MGLITSSIRQQYLNNYRLDLESKIMKINQEKLRLASSVNELISFGGNMDPQSPEAKQIEQRKERLELVEKRLDDQIQRYQTESKMVEAEYQQCKEMVDKNIQYTYGK